MALLLRPSAAALQRCTRPLLAYNKSSGYRWSPIPKPPPRHYDRLYGVHSVLNTLRVAAQHQQQQQQQQMQDAGSCSALPDDAAASSTTTPVVDVGVPAHTAEPQAPAASHPTRGHSSTSAQLHPHRTHLACLYVRDFSVEEDGRAAAATSRGRGGSSGRGGGHRHPQRGARRVIPTHYTAVRCIATLAKSLHIPIVFVPRAELVQLCGERRNQNVVLEASTYEPHAVRHLGELLWDAAAAAAADVPVTVLFLERVVDPANIGGILRTAFFFGVDHVVLSRRCSACTAAVSRASTGFLEHLHVSRATTSSVDFLQSSRRVWAAAGVHGGLEVVASTVVTESASQRRPPSPAAEEEEEDVCVPSPINDGDSSCGAGHVQQQQQLNPHPLPPAVRVLLLGNEDAGLPHELIQLCTHVAHVRSPRQARLHRCDKAGAVSEKDESGAGGEARAAGVVDEVGRRQYALRRLARLREKEVSLNVNTATAALLSALCGVTGPLKDDGGGAALGLVEVRSLR
ncbi:SpoU rRNA Methylase family [Novymonas esmeraldas]|uniref:SpoU rRNA Methylase family n=1 Tax=Novymonas esmeraldas TaxID=1808958 RepID=A0AAW0F4H3_9TRYP